jgi:hypothetical protein
MDRIRENADYFSRHQRDYKARVSGSFAFFKFFTAKLMRTHILRQPE